MKKKIAILGSTGSIGKSLLKIIEADKKKYEIILLTANKDYKSLIKQANKFKVKNLIITDKNTYNIAKQNIKNKKIKIFNNYDQYKNIFKYKIDYVMSAITGLDGLNPTIKIIKHTKNIAIANKESIICAWYIIKKELKKYKTFFIPVDSEHFSIWYGLKENNIKFVEKIYLTASGGPFYKTPLKKLKKIKINEALNHPNWKMGKKISIDSATMINKIYELIEAKNIFNFPYKKIEIIIHPKSYVHAIIKFNGGITKIIAHDTTMIIPIFNTLHFNSEKKILSKKVDFKILNNLCFSKVNKKKYPMIKLIELLPNKSSLYETVIVAANDTLVDLFLKKKIKYLNIQKELFRFIQSKEFLKYKKITPENVKDIMKLNEYVRLKLTKKVYKFSDV
tara:strand:- start:195 stop:1373 length:1179 start_codon:yes stop_codon:yes gene_type:complete